MLDPAVKLGTSTPRADPSGDYAWEVFRKADKLKPGVVRGPGEEGAAAHRRAVERGAAAGRVALWLARRRRPRRHLPDLLHRCAGRAAAKSPTSRSCALPDALAVGADYGLTVMADASPAAYRFAMFILSPAGQAILAKHGFSAPGLAQ